MNDHRTTMHNLNTAVEVAEVAEVAEVNLEQDWGYRYLTRHFPIDGRVAHLPFSHFPFPISHFPLPIFYFSPIPFSLSLCPLSPFPPFSLLLFVFPLTLYNPREDTGLLLLLFFLLLSWLATGAELVVGPGPKAGLKPESRDCLGTWTCL